MARSAKASNRPPRSAVLTLENRQGLHSDCPSIAFWGANLEAWEGQSVEVVATASGVVYDCGLTPFDSFELDQLNPEYGQMAWNVEESGLLFEGYANPLFIIDLVVAPEWRGHNIGPHLLVWMATALGSISSVFLVPTPLPTRLADYGGWVSDWEAPRRGSGAMRKVRQAYRRGGFTHFRRGTWWTPIGTYEEEMASIRQVLSFWDK